MKILTPGHKYELDHFESFGLPGCPVQTLQFIEKRLYPHAPDGGPTTQLETIHDGTTNEEVLRVLVDRLSYLQAKFPCRENAIAITKLEEAQHWLAHRTASRKARGVEGKQIA